MLVLPARLGHSPAPMKHLGLLFLFVAGSTFAQSTNPPTRLPEVEVPGNPPALQEAQLVGPYQQPEWTTQRRFPTTRVYIQRLPWEVGFEQWWRGRFFRDDTSSHLLQEELSIGLPYRMQFDLYENWTIDDDGHARHHDVATEL